MCLDNVLILNGANGRLLTRRPMTHVGEFGNNRLRKNFISHSIRFATKFN